MCRAAIIGNAAGGKSTLCRHIVRAHALPHVAVDRLQWKPNWTPVPEDQVSHELRQVIDQNRWLIDGWGPWESIEARFERADTIIVVDHPLWRHLWWATKRQIKAWGRPDTIEKPSGCNLAPMTWQMYRMIWHIHFHLRPKLLQLVARFEEQKTVHHLRSPRDHHQFVRDHCIRV